MHIIHKINFNSLAIKVYFFKLKYIYCYRWLKVTKKKCLELEIIICLQIKGYAIDGFIVEQYESLKIKSKVPNLSFVSLD